MEPDITKEQNEFAKQAFKHLFSDWEMGDSSSYNKKQNFLKNIKVLIEKFEELEFFTEEDVKSHAEHMFKYIIQDSIFFINDSPILSINWVYGNSPITVFSIEDEIEEWDDVKDAIYIKKILENTLKKVEEKIKSIPDGEKE